MAEVRQSVLRNGRTMGLLAVPLFVGVVLWMAFQNDDPEPVKHVAAGDDSPPLFRDITQDADLDFVHVDIYLTNGHLHPGHPPSRVEERARAENQEKGLPSNRLYRQEESGRFVDVTMGSGLADSGYGMGAGVGDINNDGYPDLYVSNYGPDRLYLNQQDGTFLDVTQQAGIDSVAWGASISFLDYDRDGWLDIFVTNYVDYDPTYDCHDLRDVPEFCGPQVFPGTSDRLFRNRTGEAVAEGDGAQPAVRFEDVSLKSGIATRPGPGLGVVCADFNGDRCPDIYVANDHWANFLWINNHDGTFSEEGVVRGSAYGGRGMVQGSMGIAVADVNRDGWLDLFVTNFEGENNALYLGGPDRMFTESSTPLNVASASLHQTGFGTAFVDLDHDSDLDLLILNGRVRRPSTRARDAAASATGFWESYAQPNQVLINEGERFVEHRSSSDPFTGRSFISRGLALGDIDHDGDLDMLVTNGAGPARLFVNDAAKHGHWLQVRAIEPELGSRDAYGAVVTVILDEAGKKRQTAVLNPGSSYLVSSEPVVHFGLGAVNDVVRFEVVWPDGTEERFDGGSVDRVVVLEHGTGTSP